MKISNSVLDGVLTYYSNITSQKFGKLKIKKNNQEKFRETLFKFKFNSLHFDKILLKKMSK